jgi:hypothetical protein
LFSTDDMLARRGQNGEVMSRPWHNPDSDQCVIRVAESISPDTKTRLTFHPTACQLRPSHHLAMAPQIFLSNNSSSSVNINATKNPTFQHITAAASTSTVDQIFADECNSIVERFRRGELDKYTAYFLLAKAAICDNPKDTERLLSKVAPILDREVGIALTPSVKRAHQHQGGREQVEAKANALLVNRREFQHLEEETPEYPAKRQRMTVELDLSNLVHPDNNRRLTEISPSLQRTVDVLASWSTDVEEVKRRFIIHPGCPEFPHTEWDNIIAGRPVDLGVVLSDDGRSQTVTTFTDWNRAWMQLAKAYRFAFPHRTEELRAYEEYIINKFDSNHVPYHFRIINFDKAVRKRVGSRRDLELSDFQKFQDLHTSYFSPHGRNYRSKEVEEDSDSASRVTSTKGKKRRALCRRWNSGICMFTSSICDYIHACNVQGCGSTDHHAYEHDEAM